MPATSAVAAVQAYEIPDARHPNTEVAGEAWREDELIRALGRDLHIDEEIEDHRTAILVPEPDNPHEPNAISVRIQGRVVGYIPRGETSKYLPAINRIAASGYVASTTARIWAIKRRQYDGTARIHSNIRVAAPWDGIALQINDPPATDYSLLPWGGSIQVSGEEAHFAHVKEYVPASGHGVLIVTLHRSQRILKSGDTREIVEVNLDGTRIGELTSTTSRHFLPTIDHLADQGTTVCELGTHQRVAT